MRFSQLTLSTLVTSVAATNLYVSSYSGNITTLKLSRDSYGSYSLSATAVNEGCSPSASWLTKDEGNGIVYCVDEGFTSPNGTISSFSTSPAGDLTQLDHHLTLGGPVSSVVYNGGEGVAVAHYSGSSVTSYAIQASGGLEPLQEFTFVLSAPGTNPDRQDAPHPHEALIDPTDSFVVVPDLGADLIRVFTIDPKTTLLKESTPFSTPPGSGPRHGAFLVSQGKTYFYLVSELANTVATYNVTYGWDTLNFEELAIQGTYGNRATPDGAAVAEALLSPDKRFLLTSSRNDNLYSIPNFDSTNSTKIVSDTLQSWSINPSTGCLTFVQLAPAGGRFPRQFSVNKNGTLAAVGLQSDARVVIVERDVEKGTFGKFVAEIGVPGEVTSVIWDE